MDTLSKYRNYWEKEITASTMAQSKLVDIMDRNFRVSLATTKENIETQFSNQQNSIPQVVPDSTRIQQVYDDVESTFPQSITKRSLDWSPLDSIAIDQRYPLKSVILK